MLGEDVVIRLHVLEMVPPVGDDRNGSGIQVVMAGDGVAGEIRDRNDKLAMLGSMAVHHPVIQVDQLISSTREVFWVQDTIDVVDEDDAWVQPGGQVAEVQGDAMVFPDEMGENDVVPHGKAGAVLL